MTWQPGMTLEDAEKQIIVSALRFYGNNKAMTARSLGICARTLGNKLEQYGTKETTSESDTQGHGVKITADTSSGLHLESVKVDATKQSVPVQERQEVQKLPLKSVAGRSPNKGVA